MSPCQINFSSFCDRIMTLVTFFCKRVTYLCPFLIMCTGPKKRPADHFEGRRTKRLNENKSVHFENPKIVKGPVGLSANFLNGLQNILRLYMLLKRLGCTFLVYIKLIWAQFQVLPKHFRRQSSIQLDTVILGAIISAKIIAPKNTGTFICLVSTISVSRPTFS